MPTKTQLAALLITISNLAHAGTLTPVQIMPSDYDEQFPSSYAEIQAGPAAVSQKSCAAKPNAVWVSRDWAEKGLLWGANNRHVEGCIRYFPSHDVGRNSRLLIYLHGDRVEPEGFKDGSYKAQIAEANRIARDQGVAVVLIGRPGVYGSTGDNHARDRRMPIENNLVYAAIDAIKAKHGYDRIDLAGQSGGGYLTIAMLTMGRTDRVRLFKRLSPSYTQAVKSATCHNDSFLQFLERCFMCPLLFCQPSAGCFSCLLSSAPCVVLVTSDSFVREACHGI